MQQQAVPQPRFAALAVPNFRRYVSGQSLSLIGTWVETVAQALLVLHLTRSGTVLGLTTAARWRTGKVANGSELSSADCKLLVRIEAWHTTKCWNPVTRRCGSTKRVQALVCDHAWCAADA